MDHKCTLCDYASNRKANLVRHMNIHSKTPPCNTNDTVCAFCSRTFSTKYVCKQHSDRCRAKENLSTPNVSDGTRNVTINATLSTKNVIMSTKNVSVDDQLKRHTCMMCKKTFTRHWNMLKHEEKCKGLIDPLGCPTCKKVFASRASKSRHMKTCKCNTPEDATTSNTTTITQNASIISNTFIMNVPSTNSTDVPIRPLSKEDLSHIDFEYLGERLKEKNGEGILNIIQHVHFNPEMPQNHNIRLHNKSQRQLRVFGENGWEIRTHFEVACIIFLGYKSILIELYNTEEYKSRYDPQYIMDNFMTDLLKIHPEQNTGNFARLSNRLFKLAEKFEKRSGANTLPPLPRMTHHLTFAKLWGNRPHTI